jgi:hypothetical protein
VTESKAPPEGWYQDPYGSHEARWFSVGTPTALVRDAGVEAHDPPPADATSGVVEPNELPEETSGASDVLRADDAEAGAPADGRTPGEAALDAFPQSAPWS